MTSVPPYEIAIVMHRRQIAITNNDGTERLAFFHKWNECGDDDYALVENTGGRLEYVRPEKIRFLFVDDDVLPEVLEKTYHDIGILKGGAE